MSATSASMGFCPLDLGLFRLGSGLLGPLHTLRTRRRGSGAGGLTRDRHLRRWLTLRPAGQTCTDHFSPAPGALRRGLRSARELAKRRLASRVAPFTVAQV